MYKAQFTDGPLSGRHHFITEPLKRICLANCLGEQCVESYQYELVAVTADEARYKFIHSESFSGQPGHAAGALIIPRDQH